MQQTNALPSELCRIGLMLRIDIKHLTSKEMYFNTEIDSQCTSILSALKWITER